LAMDHLPEFLHHSSAQLPRPKAGRTRAGDDHRVEMGERLLVEAKPLTHRSLHAVPRHCPPQAAPGDHDEPGCRLLLAQNAKREQRSLQTLTTLENPGDVPPAAEAVFPPKGWAHVQVQR